MRAPLFVVADGMGGAQAGEVASEMAVEPFGAGCPTAARPRSAWRCIEEANRASTTRSRPTTSSAPAWARRSPPPTSARTRSSVAHVGDSRAYLLRDGELSGSPTTTRWSGELVARGKLTEEQAEEHPQRSVITRALGPEPSVAGRHVDDLPARAGDVFLLCSDGLTSMVARAASSSRSSRAPARSRRRGRALIAAANEAGGRDNITVVLFRLEEVGGAGAADRPRPRATPTPTRRVRDVAAARARPPRQGVTRRPRRSPTAEAD